ncbi:sodium:solute symporter [candidate division KSB1 bacterium]|nr:sodium:solute symporter [candidate division KSB1 bacterium]
MITYFAVGSGKFISTFLGIPDIGKVTNVIDDSERATIDQQFLQLDQLKNTMVTNVDAAPSLKSEIMALDNSFQEMHTSWNTVTKDVQNVTSLQVFSMTLPEFMVVSKSLKSTVDHQLLSKPTPELQSLAVSMQDIVTITSQLNDNYQSATFYSIMITGEFLAATLMIVLAMLYTVASGLYGVVWTDVFQGVLIFGTIVYICVLALVKFDIPDLFSISIPMRDGTFQAIQTTREVWTNVVPPWKLHFPTDSIYSVYNLFGIAILFYLIKVTIEGAGGTSGYMIQRYFAAKSDRDAGLLSLFWTFLLSFRWPFISAIAVLGVAYGTTHGVISDPEKVLPVVIMQLVPVGMKGLLVAGLMAAAMSTFDSTVNAGAAYWVKDIYQAYIKPDASPKSLMRHSRWASVIIVVLGLLFSLAIRNINEIWGWITMSIGAGMIIPTLVRWYWWRLNGWGFAIGTVAGMLAAIIQRLMFPDVPEYIAFSFASGISFVAMVIATYATAPTDEKVLSEFYKITRPFGFWAHIRGKMPAATMAKVNIENKRDIISIFMAVPWQVLLFLMWIMVIMKRWDSFGYLLVIVIALSIGLYFSWFRHLSTEVNVDESSESIS